MSTADNILMNMDATVVWRVKDAEKAAVMVTDTMVPGGGGGNSSISASLSMTMSVEEDVGSLSKLRRDVLKQTLSSIARFVSGVNYADYFHYVNSIKSSRNGMGSSNGSTGGGGSTTGMVVGRKIKIDEDDSTSQSQMTIENPMFDIQSLEAVVAETTRVTSQFGVEIMGVSIISAHPVDQTIMNSISSSAVRARAVEIEAEAASVSTNITAEAAAKAVLIKARAEAQADILRSDGAKESSILKAEGDKEVSKLGVGISKMKMRYDDVTMGL